MLPTCAQGSVEPSSRWLGEGENKWSSSWGLILLLLILVSVLLVSTWIHIRREGIVTVVSVYPARRCTSPLGVVPVGLGRRRWRLSRRRQFSGKMSFYFPCISFLVRKLYSFFQGKVSFISVLLGMLVALREPTLCYRDAYSVGTLVGIMEERAG